jgi:dipeptidyl aminopeptidase/acylaminoacyl peptidase
MGLPEDNPAGYDRGSNLALSPRLKGKLLLVQGTSDVNVSFADTMKMVFALTESGNACDLILLPGQPHEPTGRSLDRWRTACRDYFLVHLRP